MFHQIQLFSIIMFCLWRIFFFRFFCYKRTLNRFDPNITQYKLVVAVLKKTLYAYCLKCGLFSVNASRLYIGKRIDIYWRRVNWDRTLAECERTDLKKKPNTQKNGKYYRYTEILPKKNFFFFLIKLFFGFDVM